MALAEVLASHGPNPSANHRQVALGSWRVQPLPSARCACRLCLYPHPLQVLGSPSVYV